MSTERRLIKLLDDSIYEPWSEKGWEPHYATRKITFSNALKREFCFPLMFCFYFSSSSPSAASLVYKTNKTPYTSVQKFLLKALCINLQTPLCGWSGKKRSLLKNFSNPGASYGVLPRLFALHQTFASPLVANPNLTRSVGVCHPSLV